MRTETRNAYVAGVTRAVEYVFSCLDEELTPQALAREACFSTYHFHRIFGGMIGESMGDFVRRIRLERAAWRLMGGGSVTDAAFEAAFESHAAFTRAFRDRFGFAPSEYRRRRIQVFELQNPSGLHYDPYGRPPVVRPLKRGPLMQVEIREQPPVRTAAMEHRGPYWQIGDTFGQLCRWAVEAGIPLRDGDAIRERALYAIYYDCPDETPAEKLRADVCVVIPPGFEIPEGPVREVVIPGGTYAIATHVGHYSGIGDSWGRFMGQWLPESGREVADRPNFECYVDDCAVTPPDRLRTELCIALKGQQTGDG